VPGSSTPATSPPPIRSRCPGGPGSGEIVVSAGGGAVGRPLLEAAVAARALSRRAGTCTWRVLTGTAGVPLPVTGEGIVAEVNRTDFTTLLANCAVSVSQCGYNTVTDLLATGARAVVVPFEGVGETEQVERARRLAARGMAVVVAEAALTPAALAAAVDRAFELPSPAALGLDLDGAATSARLLEERVRDG
jgi:predicted glycosyltransferase